MLSQLSCSILGSSGEEDQFVVAPSWRDGKLGGSRNERNEGNQIHMQKLSLTALAGAIGAVCLVAAGQTTTAIAAGPVQVAQAASDTALFNALMTEGEDLYNHTCVGCHGPNGMGQEAGLIGPRLVGNDFLTSAGAIIGQIMVGNPEHGNDYGIVTEQAVAIRRPN
jgi:mono/diheme cytochrome c family protein